MNNDRQIIDLAKNELISFYQNIKIRTQEETENISQSQLEEEKKKIYKLNLMQIIKYIKDSFDIIVSIKLDNVLRHNTSSSSPTVVSNPSEYEALLRKEEAATRQHIAVEQQMKLHLERLLERVESVEKEKEIILGKIEKQKRLFQYEIRDLQKQVQEFIDKKNEYKRIILKKDKEIKKLNDAIKNIMGKTNNKTQLKNLMNKTNSNYQTNLSQKENQDINISGTNISNNTNSIYMHKKLCSSGTVKKKTMSKISNRSINNIYERSRSSKRKKSVENKYCSLIKILNNKYNCTTTPGQRKITNKSFTKFSNSRKKASLNTTIKNINHNLNILVNNNKSSVNSNLNNNYVKINNIRIQNGTCTFLSGNNFRVNSDIVNPRSSSLTKTKKSKSRKSSPFSSTPLEQLKLRQKLNKYKKILDRKIAEMTRNKSKGNSSNCCSCGNRNNLSCSQSCLHKI